MNLSSEDLHWLAGLFEGEGCVSIQEYNPSLSIAMTDADVVARVAALWGVKVYRYVKANPRWRPMWRARLHGRAALPWIELLMPLLGERRQERIFAVLYRMAA